MDCCVQKLPESENETFCVKLSGHVCKDDYVKKFHDEIKEIIAKHGKYNLLVYYAPDYKGWDSDAADANLEAIIETGPYAHKRAYINPPEKKIKQSKVIEPYLKDSEYRFYGPEDFDKALEWVKS